MAVPGLLRKTLFPLNLVSCLRYRLFLPSKTFIRPAISSEKKNKKHSFKSLCWTVIGNYDSDVEINQAGFQCKKFSRVELRALLS